MTGPYDDLPEGEGPRSVELGPDPEDAAQETVLRHVLDAVRGGETPDVVPPTSSVAGFAEFLAVEAVLDKRWPETRIAPTLERIADLVELLGDPQRGYPVVHLTGTNGKTSTARMVDALLTEIGLRTGRYTSPHLQSATERINIDNRPLTPERYVEVYRDVAPFVDLVDARHDTPLSKFEVLTAMGFAAFADAPVEAGVVEVGLGGSWDATNVVDGDGRGGHAHRRGPRRVPGHATCSASRGRSRGSSSPAPSRCSPRRTRPSPRC